MQIAFKRERSVGKTICYRIFPFELVEVSLQIFWIFDLAFWGWAGDCDESHSLWSVNPGLYCSCSHIYSLNDQVTAHCFSFSPCFSSFSLYQCHTLYRTRCVSDSGLVWAPIAASVVAPAFRSCAHPRTRSVLRFDLCHLCAVPGSAPVPGPTADSFSGPVSVCDS